MRTLSKCFFLVGLICCMLPSLVQASGEIAFVRAPEDIPEGDDFTVLVSASAREANIDRILALSFPKEWKFKRAWKVEAGAEHLQKLGRDPEVSGLLSTDTSSSTLALADDASDFDPDAEGIVYFLVFSAKAGTATNHTASIKASLIERVSLDAIPEVDPRTKKSKPLNHDWHMVFPPRTDFSMTPISGKRLVATVRVERVMKSARALLMSGAPGSTAELHARPESLANFFERPFSISFWFRTTSSLENIVQLARSDSIRIRVGTGLLGQPVVMMGLHGVLMAKQVVNDGLWHNLVLSNDSVGKLRLFIDAGPPVVAEAPVGTFNNIVGMNLGNPATPNDFALDELRMVRTAYRDADEFDRGIASVARDTMHRAFATFHFEDFGSIARSTAVTADNAAPLFFSLDSGAALAESTSPVQLDPIILSADLVSATKVNVSWKTTCELGIKQYKLERRVGTFGPFEQVLTVEAKHGVKSPKRGQPIVVRSNYNAVEELPKLNGDISLYYRLAAFGFSEKDPAIYSVPVRIDYGVDRDVFVEQNDPNPFNPTTTITFRLAKPEIVRLSVFDIIGREVSVLANGKMDPGKHTYELDATNWPGGIYFYKVKTAKTTITRKMVLAK